MQIRLMECGILLFLSAKVSMQDSISMEKVKNYVNIRQWVKEAKSRWGLAKATAKQHWKEFLGDASIPKCKDQMGWLAMPALEAFAFRS